MDDVAMIVSFAGLLMAPFWAKWSARAIVGNSEATPQRIMAVVLASLGILAVVHIGPLLAMMISKDLLQQNLADPMFPYGLAMLVGPGVLIQVLLGVHMARDARSQTQP